MQLQQKRSIVTIFLLKYFFGNDEKEAFDGKKK